MTGTLFDWSNVTHLQIRHVLGKSSVIHNIQSWIRARQCYVISSLRNPAIFTLFLSELDVTNLSTENLNKDASHCCVSESSQFKRYWRWQPVLFRPHPLCPRDKLAAPAALLIHQWCLAWCDHTCCSQWVLFIMITYASSRPPSSHVPSSFAIMEDLPVP